MVFAYRIVKEPPNGWEVEIEKPLLWRGTFRSLDGIEWWSPVLERPLGDHHENPGEARTLERLRAIVRSHRLSLLERVADAARHLLEVDADFTVVEVARGRLREALADLRVGGDFLSVSYEPETCEDPE